MRRLAFGLFAVSLSCGGESDVGTSSSSDVGASADSAVEDSGASPDTTTTGDDSSTSADTALLADASDVMADATAYGPYPPGPYGNKVGDVLPNLKWRGFVNEASDALSNTKPFVDTSLDDLRRTARKPYGLVHVSEFF